MIINFFRNIKWVFKNIHTFRKHLYHWRPWDCSYNIDMFADALEETGRHMKKQDRFISSHTNANRCIFAAKQLRRVYSFKYWHQKQFSAYNNLTKGSQIVCLDTPGSELSELKVIYKTNNKELHRKLLKHVMCKQDEIEKAAKTDAWLYINKYIDRWWV